MLLLPKNRYSDIKALASVLNTPTVSKPKTMQKDAEKEPFKEDSKIFADGQPIVYVTGASNTEKNDLNHLIQSIQKTL